MFKEDPDWIMLLTVAAVLQLYTSILITRVSKKEEKKATPTLSPAVPRSLTGCFASQNIGEGSVRTEGLEKYRQWQ